MLNENAEVPVAVENTAANIRSAVQCANDADKKTVHLKALIIMIK